MLRIRALDRSDTARADEVLRRAFAVERSFRPRLERYLAIQPDGWLLAEDGADVVGTVGAIDYGSFGYVGLMAVSPEHQGQGVGRRLLEATLGWLDGRGVGCAILDASDAGRPLYASTQFVDVGPSLEFELPEAATMPPRDDASADVRVASAADAAEIIALDREIFGADRERLWRWLFAQPATQVLLARSPAEEALGSLCVQGQLLGPWGARTRAAAVALLARARAVVPIGSLRVLVPGDNEAARDLFAGLGLVPVRTLRHMRRGPCPPPASWKNLYGKGSYCLG